MTLVSLLMSLVRLSGPVITVMMRVDTVLQPDCLSITFRLETLQELRATLSLM